MFVTCFRHVWTKFGPCVVGIRFTPGCIKECEFNYSLGKTHSLPVPTVSVLVFTFTLGVSVFDLGISVLGTGWLSHILITNPEQIEKA